MVTVYWIGRAQAIFFSLNYSELAMVIVDGDRARIVIKMLSNLAESLAKKLEEPNLLSTSRLTVIRPKKMLDIFF